jgi:hypothetical protein
LAVLWDFKGLQGSQTQRVHFQIFCGIGPLPATFQTRRRTEFHRFAPYGFEHVQRFAWIYGALWERTSSWRGSDPDSDF